MKQGRINWQLARLETLSDLERVKNRTLTECILLGGVILAAVCLCVELVGAVIALQ